MRGKFARSINHIFEEKQSQANRQLNPSEVRLLASTIELSRAILTINWDIHIYGLSLELCVLPRAPISSSQPRQNQFTLSLSLKGGGGREKGSGAIFFVSDVSFLSLGKFCLF